MSNDKRTTARSSRKRRWHYSLGDALTFGSLCILAVIMLYPFLPMVSASLRSIQQYETGVGYSLKSWFFVLHNLPLPRELVNSTIVVSGAIFLIIALSSTAGYAFSKLPFRTSHIFFVAIVASMMIPVLSMIIPEYVNISRIGLINQYPGAILVYAALGSPFATFLMTTYFRGIPDELLEAAVIDGLSYVKIFFRIMLPLGVPAIVTIIILQFITVWNDLLVGLLFLQNPAVRTITVGIATLESVHVLNVPVLMAASLLSALPPIVVFLVFRRYLIAGLTMGMGK